MTLRDELALHLEVDEDAAIPASACWCSDCRLGVADSVLRSPAMQAIKSALYGLLPYADELGFGMTYADHLEFVHDLPPSVAEWVVVLGEEQ